ncbi:hypothetical protein N752_17190 [Desulforamulus aquiferis]|nr:hypothetical protein [Desulforamulus aquiferis]RYD03823.1 hypothetical protein N752_17190 [Desulforamulus aquiferis]
MLWEGIASYMSEQHFKYLIGCASIHIDSRDSLNQIYTFLKHKGVLTDRFKVVPQKTHRIEGIGEVRLNGTEKEVFRRLPPLMKGYQWLGAEIAGEPAYDKIFDTTDFLLYYKQRGWLKDTSVTSSKREDKRCDILYQWIGSSQKIRNDKVLSWLSLH